MLKPLSGTRQQLRVDALLMSYTLLGSFIATGTVCYKITTNLCDGLEKLPSGSLCIARLYFHGYGVMQDYREAFKWFQRSADLGNSDAQTYLGQMYYDGLGVDQDYGSSLYWYKNSADSNNKYGQNSIMRNTP
jgi:TPR repeat protein